MGSWFSSEETKVEEKTIDSSGHVNNNIIIQEARDTHLQMINNEKLLVATYLLCLFEIIKLLIFIIGAFKRQLKKKYGNKQQNKV